MTRYWYTNIQYFTVYSLENSHDEWNTITTTTKTNALLLLQLVLKTPDTEGKSTLIGQLVGVNFPWSNCQRAWKHF